MVSFGRYGSRRDGATEGVWALVARGRDAHEASSAVSGLRIRVERAGKLHRQQLHERERVGRADADDRALHLVGQLDRSLLRSCLKHVCVLLLVLLLVLLIAGRLSTPVPLRSGLSPRTLHTFSLSC
eukprot:7391479-Prymnesium_polylepis.3